MSEAVIKAEDVSVGYGSSAVVRNVNLEVGKGEIVALLGRNGAGKTTTLLGLAGEKPLKTGRVWLNGEEASGPLHARAARGFGYVPEKRIVFSQLSVAKNLDLGRGGRKKALEVAPELRPLLDRKAGVLSGGEQQLLCIARMLAADPYCVVVDELSFGLAPIIVKRLLKLLREAAQRGTAVLLVEQQVANVLKIADRAYIIKNGEVSFSGATDDLTLDSEMLESSYLG